ncbi:MULTISPECIES: DUF732 domain-containing protein [unclassified Rhodococcus (in: high G+C Gram-positive bacteria)]|uniref:DUF732 domain-containing protein n=1 Tax=unclassified Rhodococcus (in: high G+C Gram-positive bacteria) TaxID=192944 RepID=UPI0015C64C2F|nr:MULTISPECIES: DUF732 domain-containing protein [unclassified Rhodococcus (in: high G+C Gram-positive bacteria)]
MSEVNGSDDSEQEFATVDGGVRIYDDAIGLVFEASDAAHSGSFWVEFTALRSVVLYPDGHDRGSIEFDVATTDNRSGRRVDRTLVMRVSAADGLTEARILVPHLHKKSAGINANPDPDLDRELSAADAHSTWKSWVSKQNDTPSFTDTPASATAKPTVHTRPTDPIRSTRSGQLRSRTKPLIGPTLAVAVAAVISFVIFYPSQSSEPQQATAAPSQTSMTTMSPVPTSTATPQTAPPSAARQSATIAESIDAAFAQSLTDLGVDYSSPAQAVSVAKTTCRTIDNSSNPANAILAASEIAQRSGGYTRTEANDFVGLAVLAYCPEYNAYVRN